VSIDDWQSDIYIIYVRKSVVQTKAFEDGVSAFEAVKMHIG